MNLPITECDASALSEAIHAGSVSCVEVMRSYLERIDRLNPQLNAIVSLRPAQDLLAEAVQCDQEIATGHLRGWLHGIPHAIKDTSAAAGLPTTYGCRLLAGNTARSDSTMAARIKAAGAIVIGKTNVPEFGLGSHTFNELFGLTRNAWDPDVSAGGSSGGACAALAARLLPVADGSDFMGSLRNPAAWHNLFGLRPSQGLVPFGPGPEVWISQLGTEGPLARSVRDLTHLLATQAGHDARVPLSWSDPVLGNLAERLPTDASPLQGLRIGWWGDLNGHLATEPGVLTACESALARLARAGAHVEPLAPGFDPEALWQTWLVWRQALTAPRVAAVLAQPGGREKLKPEALWEHDQAQGLGFATFERACQARTTFLHHLLSAFEHHDLIALPAAQCWPFPVEQRWPREVGGRAIDTYHRWMECTIYATLAGAPAISVPAGFHPNGRWPMGLQLMARPRHDALLLRWVAAYETLVGDWLAFRPQRAL